MTNRVLHASAMPLLAAVLAAGCASTPEYHVAFMEGKAEEAEAALDERIAELARVDLDAVASVGEFGPEFPIDDGDLARACLDKAMFALFRGEPKEALEWLRPTRTVMDANYIDSFPEYLGSVDTLIAGDAADEYRGADYEHLMIRFMLAISDLLCQKQDYRAYSFQIGEKQEEILGSEFGVGEYKPREEYKRVALGAYLEGVIREGELDTSDASIAYERAQGYLPESGLIEASLERTKNGQFAPEGYGAVHVIYLGGLGPTLDQADFEVDTVVVQAIAVAALEVLHQTEFTDALQAAMVAPISVPVVHVNTAEVPALTIHADGGESATTEPLLDMNEVAAEQVEANRSMRMARAVLRRALKSTVTKEADGLLGDALSFGSAVTETADIRSWMMLPAQVQVARLELPAGDHELSFGEGASANVRVRKMADSYVVVHQPFLDRAPAILVDADSDVVELSN